MPPSKNRRPFPDEAHEELAKWVEETVAELRQAQSDVSDSFLLADTLFGLVDSTRTDVGTGQADTGDALLLVDVLFGLVDGLSARLASAEATVAALTATPALPDPTP